MKPPNPREAVLIDQFLEKLAQSPKRVLSHTELLSLTFELRVQHAFPRSLSERSFLRRLGADEKIVQRVLRHAKSHVTKDRYIKTFDPALVAAMKKLEATVDLVNQSAPRVHQIN